MDIYQKIVQVGIIGLVAWTLYNTSENGKDLAVIKTEIAHIKEDLRNQKKLASF